MKNKIINNTILFVTISLFITIFNEIFGNSNSLVGVAIVVEVLVLMGENLTHNPIKNFFKLLITNLILEVFATIASSYIWIGIILNFLVLTGIGYSCSYKLNKGLIVPFGLLYLFMLHTPVQGLDFIKRILALVFGAICIMGFQLIIHFPYFRKKNLEVKQSDLLYYLQEKSSYKKYKLFGKKIYINSIRIRYAVRIGCLVVLTAFITGFFNLHEGRWMSYTVFSLTELYADNCKIRSKQRIEGTLIGAAIIVVLFMIIKDITLRSLIILVAGYLNPFANNYRDAIICVTVSAVASVALTSNSIFAVSERIIYVGIGIIITLLANRFLLRHNSIPES